MHTLREAVLIVPKSDNYGQPLDKLVDYVAEALSHLFGGVTITHGYGAWVEPGTGKLFRDPVTIFTSAMPPDSGHVAALQGVADEVGRRAAQQAVYLRHADGTVEIRDTAHLWAAGPAKAVAA